MQNNSTKFCQECGENINIKAEICPKCGVRQADFPKQRPKLYSGKNEDGWITLILCLFLPAVPGFIYYL